MTPLNLSAGLVGWIGLDLIFLLIPIVKINLFITPLVVMGLVYVTLQVVWYSALAFLYILTAMMNPVLIGATCTALLVGVITYAALDIMSKIHHDPMTPRRPIGEQVIDQE